MLSDVELSALEDIRANIGRATSFVAGMTETEFLTDTKAFYAATRCFEIVPAIHPAVQGAATIELKESMPPKTGSVPLRSRRRGRG